jgi:hypothetical protein
VEKYGAARHATGDNIIWRMRFACWVTNATDTHGEFSILIAFPWQLSYYFRLRFRQAVEFGVYEENECVTDIERM